MIEGLIRNRLENSGFKAEIDDLFSYAISDEDRTPSWLESGRALEIINEELPIGYKAEEHHRTLGKTIFKVIKL